MTNIIRLWQSWYVSVHAQQAQHTGIRPVVSTSVFLFAGKSGLPQPVPWSDRTEVVPWSSPLVGGVVLGTDLVCSIIALVRFTSCRASGRLRGFRRETGGYVTGSDFRKDHHCATTQNCCQLRSSLSSCLPFSPPPAVPVSAVCHL